jgi:hypothetical protein
MKQFKCSVLLLAILALALAFICCEKSPEAEKSATKEIVTTDPAGVRTKASEMKSIIDKRDTFKELAAEKGTMPAKKKL